MQQNIRLGQLLKERVEAEALTAVDCLIFSLVSQLSVIFPTVDVCAFARREEDALPAIFVSMTHVEEKIGLGDTAALEIEIEVDYVLEEGAARDTQQSAAMTLLEMNPKLQTAVGIYELKARSVIFENDGVQLICQTEAVLKAANTDAVMKKIEKGVEI